MALATHSISNLYNGVSQQPITQRLSTQAKAQVNGMSRVSSGLSNRPPSERQKVLTTLGIVDVDSLKFHISKNHLGEIIYLIANTDTGNLYLYNVDSDTQTTLLTSNSYINTGVKDDLKFLLRGESIFILNKGVTVTKTGSAVAAERRAIVSVTAGFFDTVYSFDLEVTPISGSPTTTTISHTTPNGTGTGHANEIIPSYIANELA